MGYVDQPVGKGGTSFCPVSRPKIFLTTFTSTKVAAWLRQNLQEDRSETSKIPVRIGSYDFGIRNHPPEIGEGSLQLLKGAVFPTKKLRGSKERSARTMMITVPIDPQGNMSIRGKALINGCRCWFNEVTDLETREDRIEM